MPIHLEVLSRLHAIWGAFGILTGASLEVLAIGTRTALSDLGTIQPGGRAAVWLLAVVGAALAAGGLVMILIGRALTRRRPAGLVEGRERRAASSELPACAGPPHRAAGRSGARSSGACSECRASRPASRHPGRPAA